MGCGKRRSVGGIAGVSFWLFATLSGPAWGGVPVPALPGGARFLARGGAGRADALDAAGGGAVLAAASLLPRYEIWTGVELGPSWGARVGALDSRTAGYALGAGYAGSTATHDPVPAHLPGWRVPGGTVVDETTRWHDVWVGLAVPFGRGRPAPLPPHPTGPRFPVRTAPVWRWSGAGSVPTARWLEPRRA